MNSDQKSHVKAVLSQQLTVLVKLKKGIFRCVLCSVVKSKQSNIVKHIKEEHDNKYMEIMSEFPELNQSQLDAHMGNALQSLKQFGQPQNKEIAKEKMVKKETVEEEIMDKGIIKKEKAEKDEKDFAEGLKTGEVLKCCVCQDICKRGVTTPCCGAAACRGCATVKITKTRGCWLENCGRIGIKTEELLNDMVLREAVDGFKKEGVVNEALARKIKDKRDEMNPVIIKAKKEEKQKMEEEKDLYDDEEVSDSEDYTPLAPLPPHWGPMSTIHIKKMRKQEIVKYWRGGSEEKMLKLLFKNPCSKKYSHNGKEKMCFVCGELFRKLKPLKEHVMLNHQEVWAKVENGSVSIDHWKRVCQTLPE